MVSGSARRKSTWRGGQISGVRICVVSFQTEGCKEIIKRQVCSKAYRDSQAIEGQGDTQ